MQIRKEIRELAEEMERRCRESAKRIVKGDWRHYNFLSETDLIQGVQRNLAHLENDCAPAKALEAAADAANFLNFLRLRVGGE